MPSMPRKWVSRVVRILSSSAKPADAILHVPEGQAGSLPYPSKPDNLHFEIELVGALGSGGRDLRVEEAEKGIYGYGVGLDMTRRDLQAEVKKQGRPWKSGRRLTTGTHGIHLSGQRHRSP